MKENIMGTRRCAKAGKAQAFAIFDRFVWRENEGVNNDMRKSAIGLLRMWIGEFVMVR